VGRVLIVEDHVDAAVRSACSLSKAASQLAARPWLARARPPLAQVRLKASLRRAMGPGRPPRDDAWEQRRLGLEPRLP
jgi:hypothetical protein